MLVLERSPASASNSASDPASDSVAAAALRARTIDTPFALYHNGPMSNATHAPVTLCRYWVKPEHEVRFRQLLREHFPVFTRLGLVAENVPHLIFRGVDKERGIFYVETFPWKDAEAVERAHTLPEVGAVWGPMAECCSSMEFPAVEQMVD